VKQTFREISQNINLTMTMTAKQNFREIWRNNMHISEIQHAYTKKLTHQISKKIQLDILKFLKFFGIQHTRVKMLTIFDAQNKYKAEVAEKN